MIPSRLVRLLACLLPFLAWAAPAAAQNADRIQAILKKAIDTPEDQEALKARLQELETELGGKTNDAEGEYARGWLLSHLGHQEEGVKAYERSAALDPKPGQAWYNAGVVLHDMGRDKDAIDRWRKAIAAQPDLVDAAYNLGQAYFDQKDFASSLQWFQKAHTLTPDDFDAVKKVLQAQNALGRWEDAAVTREEVIRMHKESKEARLRGLKDYCFDQFDVDKLHVFAYETFDPPEKGAPLFTFKAAYPQNKVLGTLSVTGSAKAGPVRLEITVSGKTVGEAVELKTLPDYPALKERVRVLARKHLLPLAK